MATKTKSNKINNKMYESEVVRNDNFAFLILFIFLNINLFPKFSLFFTNNKQNGILNIYYQNHQDNCGYLYIYCSLFIYSIKFLINQYYEIYYDTIIKYRRWGIINYIIKLGVIYNEKYVYT